MERRSLLLDDMTAIREQSDVFGDEYEVEDYDGVADGFRPMDHDREGAEDDYSTMDHNRERDEVEDEFSPTDHNADGRHEEDMMDQPVRTVSAHYGNNAIAPMIPHTTPSRNSTRKSRSHDNPFASQEDGDERPLSLSFEPDMAHRSVSSASSFMFAQTASPRFGAGPSHPYGMYPQSTVARTQSIATQSTIRPPQRQTSMSSRAGPQHPYTLYPQGVSEDVDDEEDMVIQNPAVGFPGLGQNYHRQMGPDGEEQDIIGADGHTEQLPPYTRYPEEGSEKAPLLVPAAPTALHSRAPVAGTDPTMDLMHTTIVPTPTPQLRQSMTDESLLGRHASMSTMERMHSNVRSSASLLSTKSWSEKSWKEKKKTRFCGVPFWWYLLGGGTLVFIAAVLGGVIGGFVGGAEKRRTHILNTSATSLYDASAIATPTSGQPATGTYALSLSTPQEVQVACLPDEDQQPAWSCDIGGLPAAVISVGTQGNESGAFIFYGADDDSICYGTQASFMQTQFAPFMTVQDNDDLHDGPAYYFQHFYDKLVVLPESALSVSSSSKAKRSNIQLNPAWLQRKHTALPGDKPWFCLWNNTFLEGFIYVQSPAIRTTTLTSAAVSTTTALNSSSQASTTSTTPTMTTTSSAAAGSPTEFITTTYTEASSTGTWTGPATAYSKWSAHIEEHVQSDGAGDTHSGKRRRDEDELYESLEMYPYIVKLEERRLTNNPIGPYCQQFQILDDGSYNWVPDANGKPIIIPLDEQDPTYSAYQSAGLAGSKKMKEKRLVSGGCHCQWMSGQQA